MADEDQSRRNPRNLKGVLNFCGEVMAIEDAANKDEEPAPVPVMDDERKQHLADALNNLVANIPKQIATALNTLAKSPNIHEPMAEYEDEEVALDQLVMLVEDHPVNPLDLVKMDGLPVLLSCLDSPHASIQELACEVMAYVCQNNPDSQDMFLKVDGALQKLLNLLDNNTSPIIVKTKALFAVSCAVRNSGSAAAIFDKLNGFSYLMRAMQLTENKLFIKAIFLIQALIDDYQPSVAQLLSMGYTELLVESLCGGERTVNGSSQQDLDENYTWNGIREHSSSALLKLCTLSEEALCICSSNEHLMEALSSRLGAIEDKEELQEEREYIVSLLAMFSKKASVSSDTSYEAACR